MNICIWVGFKHILMEFRTQRKKKKERERDVKDNKICNKKVFTHLDNVKSLNIIKYDKFINDINDCDK